MMFSSALRRFQLLFAPELDGPFPAAHVMLVVFLTQAAKALWSAADKSFSRRMCAKWQSACSNGQHNPVVAKLVHKTLLFIL